MRRVSFSRCHRRERVAQERVSFQPPVIEMPVGDTFFLLSPFRARVFSRREKIVVVRETLRHFTRAITSTTSTFLFVFQWPGLYIRSQTLRTTGTVGETRENAPRLDDCDTPILARRPAYFPGKQAWSVFHSRSFLILRQKYTSRPDARPNASMLRRRGARFVRRTHSCYRNGILISRGVVVQ